MCKNGRHVQVRCEVDAAPVLLVKRTTPLVQPALDYVEATMRIPHAHESWKVRSMLHACPTSDICST